MLRSLPEQVYAESVVLGAVVIVAGCVFVFADVSLAVIVLWVEVEMVTLPVGHFEHEAKLPVWSSGEQTSNDT